MEELAVVWVAGGFFLAIFAWRSVLSYFALKGQNRAVDKQLALILTSDECKVKGKFD